MIQLLTKRLDLEPLVVSHAAKVFPQLRDPALYEYLDSEPPKSIAILETQYKRWEQRHSPDQTQDWLNWAARLRGADYVGWFQATVYANERADIAYLVFPAHQRRGYGVEACDAIIEYLRVNYPITTLRATIDPTNAPSIALARRLGMTQAGKAAHGLRFESRIRRVNVQPR